MAKALSVDLRLRAVDAIRSGLTRRQSAVRFGVSASSAIRWATQAASLGDVTPKKQGGDRRSKHIEGHAAFILEAVARQPDVTLAELQARLVEERGARFGIGTLWRFFDRRRITFKNVWPAPFARSLAAGASGSCANVSGIAA